MGISPRKGTKRDDDRGYSQRGQESRGCRFEEPQADAVVTTVVAGREGLATKEDVNLLRADLDLFRAALQGDMKDLKLDLIKWLGGTMIALIGIAVAALSLILGG